VYCVLLHFLSYSSSRLIKVPTDLHCIYLLLGKIKIIVFVLNLQVAAAHDANAKAEAYRAFVNFHGELLMLLHWSILAYTGLVKILKKHRKRTGTLLHAPHLEHLLAQPFCSVEVRDQSCWFRRILGFVFSFFFCGGVALLRQGHSIAILVTPPSYVNLLVTCTRAVVSIPHLALHVVSVSFGELQHVLQKTFDTCNVYHFPS
jgi:hypothetical protein